MIKEIDGNVILIEVAHGFTWLNRNDTWNHNRIEIYLPATVRTEYRQRTVQMATTYGLLTSEVVRIALEMGGTIKKYKSVWRPGMERRTEWQECD